MTDIERLEEKVQRLENSVNTLSRDVRTLLSLWQQGKGILNFVKLCVYIAGAIGGFILFIKPYLK